MRISADPIDPGFDPARARHATVYLNGEKLDHVMTADEERGVIIKVAIDPHGRPITARDGPKTVYRHGWVRVELGRSDSGGLFFPPASH